jgi:alpha-galactosidase
LTNPDVISHIEKTFLGLKADGFEYWKIDFLHHATFLGKRYDETIPRGQAIRKGLEAIRRAVGNDIILGCGAPLGPCIGITDAMRIGTDIATEWKYDWGAGVYECTINTISRAVQHNKWWTNDPDCVLVRQEDNNLTLDEIILWLSVVAMSGGLFLLSDRMEDLSEERLDLIDKALPPYPKGAIALDALIEPEPRLFILPIETPMGKWVVAVILNLTEKPIGASFTFSEIGLDEKLPHHVWNFWEQEYEGITEQQVDVTGLKPHSCKLLAIRPESEIPSILSTSMHFTQGAMELNNFEWDDSRKALLITITKTTRKPEAIFFVFSAGWIPETAFLDGEQIKLEMVAPEVIAVRHQYERGQILKVNFSKQ